MTSKKIYFGSSDWCEMCHY